MPNPREEVERGDLVERRILEEAVASPCFWLFETFVEQIGREPQPTDTVLMLTREECQNILAALSRAEAEREKKYSGPALERATAAMWHKHADEPLQVGKFKEPLDYRSYGDLYEPAREMLRGYARAALLAFLDPEDEEMAEWVAKEHCGFHRDPQLNTDWRYHLRDAHGIVAALRAFLSRDAREPEQ